MAASFFLPYRFVASFAAAPVSRSPRSGTYDAGTLHGFARYSHVVRKRLRHDLRRIEVAPRLGHIVERRADFVRIEQRHQLQPKSGSPLK